LLDIIIRPKERADAPMIRAVIVAAFENQPYSNHAEYFLGRPFLSDWSRGSVAYHDAFIA